MRESLRGYTAAMLDELPPDELAGVSGELSGFLQILEHDEDLRHALTDPSVPLEARKAIVADLLAGRASPPTSRIVGFAVANERASELQGALEWVVRRIDQATVGTSPREALPGRLVVRERLDGYATAVFEQTDRGVLEEVEDELFRFARTVEGSRELSSVLTDLDRPLDVRAGVVTDLLSPAAQRPSVLLAVYATRAGRARDYVALLDWLVERTASERNLRIAEVRSALELDREERERLARALGRLAGRDVELRVTVDPSLIGGVVALVGDTIIDGSIKSRLERLHSGLAEALSAQEQTGDRN